MFLPWRSPSTLVSFSYNISFIQKLIERFKGHFFGFIGIILVSNIWFQTYQNTRGIVNRS